MLPHKTWHVCARKQTCLRTQADIVCLRAHLPKIVGLCAHRRATEAKCRAKLLYAPRTTREFVESFWISRYFRYQRIPSSVYTDRSDFKLQSVYIKRRKQKFCHAQLFEKILLVVSAETYYCRKIIRSRTISPFVHNAFCPPFSPVLYIDTSLWTVCGSPHTGKTLTSISIADSARKKKNCPLTRHCRACHRRQVWKRIW